MKNEIRVALVGFGGIARSHTSAYLQLMEENAGVRLVAVCDCDETRFNQKIKINLDGTQRQLPPETHYYTDAEDLIENEDFDMVDICVPTYLHCEMSIRFLRAGKHVLVEKPMALSFSDCQRMLSTAKETGKRLMVGQCLRFEPAYVYLKECVDQGYFGKLKNLYMTRLSKFPDWSAFYASTEQSGGCILDLHVHDLDMANFILGQPESISTIAFDDTVRWQHVNTRLFYSDLAVIVTGSFTESNTCPFSHGYRARFEKASVIFEKEQVWVYPDEGEPTQVELLPQKRIAEEIRYFSQVIRGEHENVINPPEGAAAAIHLVERLRESVEKGGERLAVQV